MGVVQERNIVDWILLNTESKACTVRRERKEGQGGQLDFVQCCHIRGEGDGGVKGRGKKEVHGPGQSSLLVSTAEHSRLPLRILYRREHVAF